MEAHHESGKSTKRIQNDRYSLIEPLESRRLLSGSVSDVIVNPSLAVSPAASASSIQGYTPAQMKAA